MNLIETARLIFKYRQYPGDRDEYEERTALSDINLSIRKGDFVGILGHNGSGKSTLARQLTALLTPSDGVVYVDGLDSSDSNHTLQIRKTAGIVFQNPDNQLLGNTVEEDVAFGMENLGLPRDEMDRRITELLSVLGLTEYRMSSPNTLSGGQKQKAAIAGVLAMEPSCIVFDEPTAMLDPAGRAEVRNAIRMLNRQKGITIIYITHHLEEVADADFLYVMKQGKIAMEGRPEELWTDCAGLAECGLKLPFLEDLIEDLAGRFETAGKDIRKEIRGKRTEEELISYLTQELAFPSFTDGTRLPESAENDSGMTEKGIVSQVEKNDRTGLEDHEGLLLSDVSFSYDQPGQSPDRKALNHISLSIHRGEFLAIAGQTGSGKSTLLQHLNGLIPARSGRVLFNGKEIPRKGWELKELRQKVGLCFQYPEYQLFEENVIKDIAFGPSNLGYDQDTCMEKARQTMELLELPADISNLSPFSLSGGQKRRVALAGILAMEPEYLVLDEPAAGLDHQGKERLFALLRKLNKEQQTTIILVSHDMDDIAAHADRLVIMKEGSLLADGKPADLFSDRNLMNDAGLNQPDVIKFYQDFCAAQREGGMAGYEADGRVPLNRRELVDRITGQP